MLIYEPIWLIFIALIAAGFFIQRKNTGSFFNITISNVFYYFFLLNIVLGTIAVYSKTESISISTIKYDERFVFWTIMSVGLCGLIVPLGSFLVNLLFRKALFAEVNEFVAKRTERLERPGPILCLVLLCLIVVFLYVRSLPEIPLLSIFKGLSSLELAALRSEATNAFSGKYYRYSIFFHHLLPFLCFVLFSWQLVHKRKTILIFSILTVTALIQMIDMQKGPVITFALGLFFVYIMTRSKRLEPKFMLGFVLSAGIFAVVMTRWFMSMGDRSVGVILNAVFERIVGGQVRPLYYYFEIFPSVYDFLGLKGLPNPGSLLPFKPFPITAVVHDQMFPGFREVGIHGSAPTVFYGEFYACFGFIGAIACMFGVGLLLGFADRMGTRFIKKDPLGVALFVWLGLHLSSLASTGASFLLFNVRLMLILLAYVFLRSWNSRLQNSSQPLP